MNPTFNTDKMRPKKMGTMKSQFSFTAVHKYIIKQSSLRNNFWTDDKFSS